MKIYVTNGKEQEMLEDFLNHTLHDLQSVQTLYGFDQEGYDSITTAIKEVAALIENIKNEDRAEYTLLEVIDKMIGDGLSDEKISELTGIDKLTIKRCRMRSWHYV